MKTIVLAGVAMLCLVLAPPSAGAASAAPAIDDHVAPFPIATGPAAARINGALERATVLLRRAIAACHQDAREQNQPSGWTRTALTTMDGPEFLSIVTVDDAFCGGAHPDSERSALVYDRQTGSPVNWVRLLPPSLDATGKRGGSLSGNTIGLVMSSPMLALYRKLYPARLPDVDDADRQACLDSVEDGFVLWPDSSRHALFIQPTASAHATAACAVPVALSSALLRSMGADLRLTTALEARR